MARIWRDVSYEANDVPVSLSSCKLTQAERQELDSMWELPEYSLAKLSGSQHRTAGLVGPPSRQYTAILEAMCVNDEIARRARFDWFSLVCNQRDFFKQCMLKFITPDGELLLKAVHILMSPHVVHFNNVDSSFVAK